MTEQKALTPFQQALLDSVLAEYRDIPVEDTGVPFSEAFLKKADKLLRAAGGPVSFRTRRILRGILIAALIAALLAGTVLAIPAVREGLIGFSLYSRGESYGVRFDPEAVATAPDSIETPYTLGYLPDGYMKETEYIHGTVAVLEWVNSEEEYIGFSQFTMPDRLDDHWIILGDGDDPRKTVLMGDYMTQIIYNKYVYLVTWTDNEYFFVLELPRSMDEKTLEQIFLSCQPAP